MKSRQFKQLASGPKDRRLSLLLEGLKKTAEHVGSLAAEAEAANEAEATHAARLVTNVATEEAGKFLLLLDGHRVSVDQKKLGVHYHRAGNHLAKLLYAQMADYRIADYAELRNAIDRHRRRFYLDGPNEVDFIMPNDLLSRRETPMYIDLIDAEGELEWWTAHPETWPLLPGRAVNLVLRIAETGLLSASGLEALRSAWRDFDPETEGHCRHWARRTLQALMVLPQNVKEHGQPTRLAWHVADEWPMPMVELDLTEDASKSIPDLQDERRLYEDRQWSEWYEADDHR